MGQYPIQVPRAQDRSVVDFLIEVAQVTKIEQVTVSLSGMDHAIGIAVQSEDTEPHWVAKSTLYSIRSGQCSRQGFSISFDRRTATAEDVFFDIVTINTQPQSHDLKITEEHIRKIHDAIDRHLRLPMDAGALPFADKATVTKLLSSHQNMLARMQSMVVDVGENATKTRLELEQDITARKGHLEAEFAAKAEKLSQDADARKSELDAYAEELSKKSQTLDDRSNTHARRDIHKELKVRIADRFKQLDLTPQTKDARWPIHAAVVLSSAIFAVLIWLFTTEALLVLAKADRGTAESLLVIAKSATASLAFLGVITWYLRWLNRWFERLADAEFGLKQFELDINRAQWVVETAFEWKITQNTPMPAELLTPITHNLFSRQEKDETADMHPADYLASALIGKASNVKLAVPGAEIELGPKALKGAGN